MQFRVPSFSMSRSKSKGLKSVASLDRNITTDETGVTRQSALGGLMSRKNSNLSASPSNASSGFSSPVASIASWPTTEEDLEIEMIAMTMRGRRKGVASLGETRNCILGHQEDKIVQSRWLDKARVHVML
eukprot:3931619-Rhodomonas_salina.2